MTLFFVAIMKQDCFTACLWDTEIKRKKNWILQQCGPVKQIKSKICLLIKKIDLVAFSLSNWINAVADC